MTDNLRNAIQLAMTAMKALNEILDSGDSDAIGSLTESDGELLMDLKLLAGDLGSNANALFDDNFDLSTE